MAIEFDLSTLNLSAGTHSITIKARARGYEDSPASNAVMYQVGEELPTEINLNGEFKLVNIGLGNIAGIASAIKIYYSLNDGNTWILFNELNNNLYGEGVGNITKKITHNRYIKFKVVINSKYKCAVSIYADRALPVNGSTTRILDITQENGSVLEEKTYTSSNIMIGAIENINIYAQMKD